MLIHAPAKVNLCLYLGPRRDDGLHEICSLFCPVALADLLEVSESDRDEVICAGVDGENLADRALRALREHGWDAPARRIEIEKRIPVAAGLGGGSADAAAVLRLAAGQVPELEELAMQLGADVPSQLSPSLALVEGAGERVERLPAPAPHALVLLPDGGGLPTAEVYAEADRLGLGRETAELEDLAARLRGAAGGGDSPLAYRDLLQNDLEPAALSLRPSIASAKEELEGAGAEAVFLSGSGPTVAGIFRGLGDAERAAEGIPRDGVIVSEAGTGP